MKNQKIKKEEEYAEKLIAAVKEVFNKESEYYIGVDEIRKGNNANAFIHALATLMPTVITNCLLTDSYDMLAFNHLANGLIMEFTKIKKK